MLFDCKRLNHKYQTADEIMQACDDVISGKFHRECHFPLVIWQMEMFTQSNMIPNEDSSYGCRASDAGPGVQRLQHAADVRHRARVQHFTAGFAEKCAKEIGSLTGIPFKIGELMLPENEAGSFIMPGTGRT